MRKKITSPEEKRKIADRISQMRDSRGWTNAFIGEKIGYEVKNVSRIFKGSYKPSYSLEMLEKIADLFKVRLEYVLCEDDFPTEAKMIAAFDQMNIEEYDWRTAYLKMLGFEIHPQIGSVMTLHQIKEFKSEILQFCDEESAALIKEIVPQYEADPELIGCSSVFITWETLPDPDVHAHLKDVRTGKGSSGQILVRHSASMKDFIRKRQEIRTGSMPVSPGSEILVKSPHSGGIGSDIVYELYYFIRRTDPDGRKTETAAFSPDELQFLFKQMDAHVKTVMTGGAEIPNYSSLLFSGAAARVL